MKRLDKATTFITRNTPIVNFHLEKEYRKKDKKIVWSLSILPQKEIKTVTIRLQVLQTIHGDDKTTQIVLGTQKINYNEPIPAITWKKIWFDIPLSFKTADKKEKEFYTWEMALMNRVHDQSQKQRYTYSIRASLLYWKRKQEIDFSHKVFVK